MWWLMVSLDQKRVIGINNRNYYLRGITVWTGYSWELFIIISLALSVKVNPEIFQSWNQIQLQT